MQDKLLCSYENQSSKSTAVSHTNGSVTGRAREPSIRCLLSDICRWWWSTRVRDTHNSKDPLLVYGQELAVEPLKNASDRLIHRNLKSCMVWVKQMGHSSIVWAQYNIKKFRNKQYRTLGRDHFEFSNKERNEVLGIIGKGNINLVLLDGCKGNIIWKNCHSIFCLIR